MTFVGKLSNEHFRWWCPGCEDMHIVPVEPARNGWGFSGDVHGGYVVNPTLTPSVLVQGGFRDLVCHTFIRNGQIEFLGDCTHALAGQTVPMMDLSTL